MAWIRSVAKTIMALFVDDARFAVAILAWAGSCALILPALPVPAVWRGPLLFAGLAAILLDSALRRARR